jgi:hypothetical protein
VYSFFSGFLFSGVEKREEGASCRRRGQIWRRLFRGGYLGETSPAYPPPPSIAHPRLGIGGLTPFSPIDENRSLLLKSLKPSYINNFMDI